MTNTPLNIALIGDYDPDVTAHQAIKQALPMSANAIGVEVCSQWLATDRIDADTDLSVFDGFWCVPASPYQSLDGALRAITFARTRQRPFLGTCGGFQHALLEYARNVLGWHDAKHGELNPDSTRALLTPLSCAPVETVDSIRLVDGSHIARLYGARETHEGYRCRYGINPQFQNEVLAQDLYASGHDSQGDIRAVELRSHPFFIATLFQPERAALLGRPVPLVNALLMACRRHSA